MRPFWLSGRIPETALSEGIQTAPLSFRARSTRSQPRRPRLASTDCEKPVASRGLWRDNVPAIAAREFLWTAGCGHRPAATLSSKLDCS
jgi:hypothetical protein